MHYIIYIDVSYTSFGHNEKRLEVVLYCMQYK